MSDSTVVTTTKCPLEIATLKTLSVAISLGVGILNEMVKGGIGKPTEEINTSELIAAALTSDLNL